MHTKTTAVFALFCALALVLGYFENLIPVSLVVPGGKIGLANIVTMVVFCLMGAKPALAFGVLRCFLSSVLYSGFFAFFYGSAGTVLSVLSMAAAKMMLRDKVSEIGLSIIGAAFFNLGQLAVCAAVLESLGVFRYFPALLLVSAVAGSLTGYAANRIIPLCMEKNFKSKNGDNNIWK